jgi:hypothetical protein
MAGTARGVVNLLRFEEVYPGFHLPRMEENIRGVNRLDMNKLESDLVCSLHQVPVL